MPIIPIGVVRRVILLHLLVLPKISVAATCRRTAFVSQSHRRTRQEPPQRRIGRRRTNGGWFPTRSVRQGMDLLNTAAFHGNDQTRDQQDPSHQRRQATFRTLYPPSHPYRNGTIPADSIHTLYYEEHGQFWNMGHLTPPSPISSDTSAKALDATSTSEATNVRHALFLHGGPGAGCSSRHAQFFDPTRHHIVLLDQRGAGRSQPRGETRNNTLQHLVDDCETLRRHLNISHWHVILGGSWGSTVALAYAQQHPNVIRSTVLRGICLLRPCEVDWLFSSNGGAALRLPQAWNEFCQAVGVATSTSSRVDDNDTVTATSRGDASQNPREALHSYYDRFFGDDPVERFKAARSWMTWEQTVSSSLAYSDATTEEATICNGNNKKHNFTTRDNQPLVLVSSTLADGDDSSKWLYHDLAGQPIEDQSLLQNELRPADHAIDELRRGIICPWVVVDDDVTASLHVHHPRMVRPFAVTTPTSSPNATNQLSEQQLQEIKSYLPVQSMLTCYFSVNERYVLNNTPLLHPDRMVRLHAENERTVKVVAIHGGRDNICPLDNALELLQTWPHVELRVPLNAGHSMYDPPVTHEILQATDRLARSE